MIYGKYTVKKLLAVCLILTMSMGAFGLSGADMQMSGAADDEVAEQYQAELDSLKAQQEALDKKIEEAQAEIEKQKDDLKALENKYTAVKAKIDNVEEQLLKNEDAMVELDTDLREARHDLEVKNDEIAVLRDEFMARIKTMYVAGGVNTYEKVLINSADFYDVLMRLELVKRVAEHDDESLDALMQKKREIEAVEAQIEEDSQLLRERAVQYSNMREELIAEKKSLDEIIELSGGKLDTLALDKAAMELRASQLSEDYAVAYSNAHTTTTTTTTTTESKATEEPSSDDSDDKHTTTTAPNSEHGSADEPAATTAPAQTEAPAGTDAPVTTTALPAETTTTTTTPPATTTTAQPAPEPSADSSRQGKIDTVIDYARSNVGGAYVWGGASYRATDCSGLVMLSYAQIGVSLPHNAAAQANYGTSVSYSDLQPGDLVFFGYGGLNSIYHVAIYSGSGRIIHAANSGDGIIISDLNSFSRYNPVVALRRII